MAKEVERKFLIKDDAWRAAVERSIAIRQFYIAVGSDRSVRVRISDGLRARLTVKFGATLPERDEFEYEIPLDDALTMMAFCVGTVIEKTRHHVRFGGYLYEVDEYAGKLGGLVVAELETRDRVDLLPAWIGREVTGDQRYSNAVLALSAQSPEVARALAG